VGSQVSAKLNNASWSALVLRRKSAGCFATFLESSLRSLDYLEQLALRLDRIQVCQTLVMKKLLATLLLIAFVFSTPLSTACAAVNKSSAWTRISFRLRSTNPTTKDIIDGDTEDTTIGVIVR